MNCGFSLLCKFYSYHYLQLPCSEYHRCYYDEDNEYHCCLKNLGTTPTTATTTTTTTSSYSNSYSYSYPYRTPTPTTPTTPPTPAPTATLLLPRSTYHWPPTTTTAATATATHCHRHRHPRIAPPEPPTASVATRVCMMILRLHTCCHCCCCCPSSCLRSRLSTPQLLVLLSSIPLAFRLCRQDCEWPRCAQPAPGNRLVVLGSSLLMGTESFRVMSRVEKNSA